jgi:hypothetical protein
MANYEEQSDGFTYDVFLSFRGEDTRENIVAYLLDAFKKRGINAFYDDTNLEIGEELSPAFDKAIEESNISVIVLSENYASSKWCLNELAKIMESTKTNKKQIAFPIFYHVDPSDVRNQRNNYGKAMDDHKETYREDSEKVKAWTAALSEVANLKGHHYHIHKGYVIPILLLYNLCLVYKLNHIPIKLELMINFKIVEFEIISSMRGFYF